MYNWELVKDLEMGDINKLQKSYNGILCSHWKCYGILGEIFHNYKDIPVTIILLN